MDLTAYSIRCRRYYLITTNVQCFHDSTIIRWAEQNCVFFLHRKIIPEVNFICLSHSCISGIISALKRIKREPTRLRCPRSLLLNFMLSLLYESDYLYLIAGCKACPRRAAPSRASWTASRSEPRTSPTLDSDAIHCREYFTARNVRSGRLLRDK